MKSKTAVFAQTLPASILLLLLVGSCFALLKSPFDPLQQIISPLSKIKIEMEALQHRTLSAYEAAYATVLIESTSNPYSDKITKITADPASKNL